MKYAWDHKPNRGAERTISAIGRTFLELLQEQSFEKITIKEICTRANYPRATFYNYFEDKYDLLEFYFFYLLNNLDLGDIDKNDFDVYAHFDKLYDFLSQYQDVIKSILKFNKQDGDLISYSRRYLRQFLLSFMKEFNIGNGDIPFELMSEYYSITLELIIKWTFIVEQPISKEEAKKYLKTFLVYNT